MNLADGKIDGGKKFDFGRTSDDYAKYRDIYPNEFYEKLAAGGIGIKGQKILDLGTGTGVLPRNMQKFGAKWTGIDISENQIEQAKRLASSEGSDIDFLCSAAEELDIPDGSFDAVTACQCFWYFDTKTLIPKLDKLLKPHGMLAVLEMAWLPYDDALAGECEELILKHNPKWTGRGYTRKEVYINDDVLERFDIIKREGFDVNVPFTRESWHGRLRACRGTAASMSECELSAWEKDNKTLLEEKAPENFCILHHAAMCLLRKKQ